MAKYSQILVAEDDVDQREEMSEYLTTAGFSVVTATDGYDAMEQIGKVSPRVILLDINMPGWDGLRVAEAASNLDHRCVIILMTGDDVALRNAVASECGAIGVFAKPVKLDKLIDFLESIVGRRVVSDLRAS